MSLKLKGVSIKALRGVYYLRNLGLSKISYKKNI